MSTLASHTAALSAQSTGISESYGIEWARAASAPPRNWIVANVEPTSPAGAILQRGDRLTSVDGVDFVSGSNTNAINTGRLPADLAPHTFEFVRESQVLSFTIAPALVLTAPVRAPRSSLMVAFESLKTQGAERLGKLCITPLIVCLE